MSMISFTALVVVPHQSLASPTQVEPILEAVRPVLGRARELPKHHLDQQLALGCFEIQQKGRLCHMAW